MSSFFYNWFQRIRNLHKQFYFWILCLIAVSLPLSFAGLGIGMVLLFLNWLIEGGFQNKIRIFRKNKSLQIFLLLYLIHLAGMIYSIDLKYGFHDLQMKISLILFPLVIGTSEPLGKNRFIILNRFFIGAVMAGSFISLGLLLGIGNSEVTDVRDISIFISHIRFSLMIVLSIFFLIYLLRIKDNSLHQYTRMIDWVSLLWLIVFLFILKSMSGIIIFFLIIFILAIAGIIQSSSSKRIFYLFLIISLSAIVFIYSGWAVSNFYDVENVDLHNLEPFTGQGNKYTHDTITKGLENGNYVWIYLCEKELKKEWNERSGLDYDGKDKAGQSLKYTLIRYMSSLGLRKDSAGIAALTKKDIQNIENGYANYIFTKKFSLYSRVYTIIWEIDEFRYGYSVNGHSVSQRIIYVEQALKIIRSHFWFGVGTGDVKTAFQEEYRKDNRGLTEKWQLRAHNQYLTFLLTFGFPLFLLILYSMFYPAVMNGNLKRFIFLVFFIIAFCSMLNEDTLETHTGAGFFSFFYSLYLWGTEKLESTKEITG